jgi:hypothetical protein
MGSNIDLFLAKKKRAPCLRHPFQNICSLRLYFILFLPKSELELRWHKPFICNNSFLETATTQIIGVFHGKPQNIDHSTIALK